MTRLDREARVTIKTLVSRGTLEGTVFLLTKPGWRVGLVSAQAGQEFQPIVGVCRLVDPHSQGREPSAPGAIRNGRADVLSSEVDLLLGEAVC